jgi:hypothetical protein
VVVGVDFSGARLAGRNIWLARLTAAPPDSPTPTVLTHLDCLERLCQSAERETALAHLVERILASEATLWALDFPFALPLEIVGGTDSWLEQLSWVARWEDGAHAFGHECLRRARLLGGANHLRRTTDRDLRAPFDPYHYRIIYQTFHGMRDVLAPLAAAPGVAVLPFQYPRLRRAHRVLVEACPSSTLKRLGLPHQNYKQPTGGPLTRKRRLTRRRIVEGLAPLVALSAEFRRIIMRNPGGDALDAVIAAVGGWQAWREADHRAVARHPRYPREGRMFV